MTPLFVYAPDSAEGQDGQVWTWESLCVSSAQGSIAALEFTFLRCFIWVLSPSLYMVLCVTHILNCVAVLLFIAYVADEKIKCMSQVRSVTLDTWLPEQVEFISGIAVYSCYNILFFSINFGSFHIVFWSWNWPAFRCCWKTWWTKGCWWGIFVSFWFLVCGVHD